MKLLGVILLTSIFNIIQGQSFFDYSDSLNKPRRNAVIATEAIGTVSSLYLLNEVWYKNYASDSFHTFDDGSEWLQMDKIGHTMTSYYVGIAGIEALKWSGVKHKKASIFGGSLGLIYLTGVEFLDGYSSQWGFSWYDMLANASGTVAAISQELTWKEQRIKLKYSAHYTKYAEIRPNLLGSNGLERLLKDYNGQTYWASINIKSFLKEDSKFPSWLNLAVGYGAEELVSGETNAEWCLNNPECDQLNRYRQYYLSFDIDMTKFNFKRKVFKTIFGAIGFIKIPAPALQFSNRGVRGHLFYF